MSYAKNAAIAVNVACWLERHGCTTTVIHHEDVFEVHYTLKNDVLPQPAIRIDGSVVFPKGSQEDIVLMYLLGQ